MKPLFNNYLLILEELGAFIRHYRLKEWAAATDSILNLISLIERFEDSTLELIEEILPEPPECPCRGGQGTIPKSPAILHLKLSDAIMNMGIGLLNMDLQRLRIFTNSAFQMAESAHQALIKLRA